MGILEDLWGLNPKMDLGRAAEVGEGKRSQQEKKEKHLWPVMVNYDYGYGFMDMMDEWYGYMRFISKDCGVRLWHNNKTGKQINYQNVCETCIDYHSLCL